MNLTNELNLPSLFVKAVQNDTYSGGQASDYSTTGLLQPPRIAALRRKHKEHLTEDVSDRIFSLFGQVVHTIIERAATNEIVEKRLFMTVDGKTVSGQIDLYHEHTLWDWKTCSIWVAKDGIKDEWAQQGNINRLLCHENDIDVRAIQYGALYRDWSLMKASRERDYPQKQVELFNLPIWPLDKTRAFVSERIAAHEAARTELPMCSPAERWERPTKWAVMKKGAKRALKLHDTKDAATLHSESLPNTHVEDRPGESVRCLHYCPVVQFCTFGRGLIQEKMEAA